MMCNWLATNCIRYSRNLIPCSVGCAQVIYLSIVVYQKFKKELSYKDVHATLKESINVKLVHPI